MGIPSDAWFREQEWRFRLLPQSEHDAYVAQETARILRPSPCRLPIVAYVAGALTPKAPR